MSQYEESDPRAWATLVQEDDASARAAGILASLPPAQPEREAAIRAFIVAESEFPDPALRAATAVRLRALAELPVDQARTLQAEWTAVENRLPSEAAMRRAVVLRSACKSFTLEEVSRIEPFYPTVRELAGLGEQKAKPVAPIQAEAPVATDRPRRGIIGKLFGRA